MSGSTIFFKGVQLGPTNVNEINPGGWSMGWYAYSDLEPDDEQGARYLLSVGLKPDFDYFPGVPWRVFSKPRLFGVLLDSGFDVEGFLDEAYTFGYVDKVRDMSLYSLRLLFEYGAELPNLDDHAHNHPKILQATFVKEKILQPIYDGVQARRNRCRAASLAVCCIQRMRRKDRDVLGLVAKMVWKTRRSDGWNPSPPSDRFK